MDKEISRRISSAAHSFNRLTPRVWASNRFTRDAKLHLYHSLVLSHLTYAAQTWTLKEDQIRRLEVFHNRCLRRVKDVPRPPHPSLQISTEELHRRHPPTAPVRARLDKQCVAYTGHLARRPPSFLPKVALFAHCLPGHSAPAPPGRPHTDFRARTQALFTAPSFLQCSQEALTTCRNSRPLATRDELPRSNQSWYQLAQHRDVWSGTCSAMARHALPS